MLSMELERILQRIESRLKVVGLSATKASKLAGKPDAIRNIRRAVKEGRRSGVTSTTLHALAPVLKTTEGWLMTGNNGNGERTATDIISSDNLSLQEMITALTWAFQELERATEHEARALATAVARAIRMQIGHDGVPLTDPEKRNLVSLAVQLFRSKEP